MKPDKAQDSPDISGVSEEIQANIKRDLQSSFQEGNGSLLRNKKIGISVSDNQELEELGYSTIHLRDLMIEIVRNLLINGSSIVYGGNLNKEGYTYLFSDLAFQYRDKNEAKRIYLENYFAYPIYCLLSDEDILHFKKFRTKIIKVPPPFDGVQDTEKYISPNTPEAKVIWASSLTAMRNTMISNTDARILVGGKVGNYLGKMPGIIEEAKITLEQKKPLYLVGALGGAAKEVINALYGRPFTYMSSEFHQSAEYNAFRDLYNSKERVSIDADAVGAYFKELGVRQLSELNGLSEDENERLFTSANLPEMLYYIFKGLKNISAS